MAGIFLFLWQATWIETTQPDFKNGTFECNIYASQRDSGTVEFTSRWDLNNDGYLDLITANELSGQVYLYWGNDSGYLPTNRRSYTGSGGDVEVGDIDLDGYAELLTQNNGNQGIRIFQGTPAGPDSNDYYDLTFGAWNKTCFLADLNQDGYLDMTVQRYTGSYGAILWGSDSGFSTGNLELLPTSSCEHNVEIADLNKDRWLDIIFIRGGGGCTYIYWGSDSGFNPYNGDFLVNPPGNPSGCSVADLNHDGLLDVVLTCFGNSSAYARIYFGSSVGFGSYQDLAVNRCFGGSVAADLNTDGYLDLLFVMGYGVAQKPVIYWGSAAGYNEANRDTIGEYVDGSGSLIADFNDDGVLDIFIDNFSDQSLPSYVLPGPGFTTPSFLLPSERSSGSQFREIGNVYNRCYYEDYLSSIFDAESLAAWSTVDWDDSLPPGSRIAMFVRSGDTQIPDMTWSGWDSLGKLTDIPDSLDSRYLQYRCRLAYANPSCLPFLYEVRINYEAVGVAENPNKPMAGNSSLVAKPNPLFHRTSLFLPSPALDGCVRIYNAFGSQIRKIQCPVRKPGESVVWDRRDAKGCAVPAGVYFVHVRTKEKTIYRKLVVID